MKVFRGDQGTATVDLDRMEARMGWKLMKLRQMATAFIQNNGQVLMMKKKKNKFIDFEFWTALGGHIEPSEINDPRKAVLREIEEESGLQKTDIGQLELRYILKRLKGDEIRIQYVYFGSTSRNEFVESDEGELYWIDEREVCSLKLSAIVREMFNHYLANKNRKEINVGVITADINPNKYIMQWSEIKDPGVF